MKKVTLMFLTLILVSAFNSQIFAQAQILLNENFNYPKDALLTANGWVNTSGTGTNLKVSDGNLIFGQYPNSGVGGSVYVTGGNGSREDVNHAFTQQNSGTLYASFLVRVDSASSTGDYFFHFKYNGGSNIFLGRTYLKDDGTKKNFYFGLCKSSTSPVYTTEKYNYGQTYLLVVKYEYVGDAAGKDDKVSLYVNPISATTEPTAPTLENVQSDTSKTDSPLNAVGIRQGANNYGLFFDGLRVSLSWDSLQIGKTIPVTFQVDMSVQINKAAFDVKKDSIVVRGSFQKDAGDAGDWSGMNVLTADPNKDNIYTATVYLPADSAGKAYKYKFVKNSGGWESSSDRPFTLTAPGPQVLGPDLFNNEKPASKTYHITFIADLSGILGATEGFFNPATDSIIVDGLNWEGGTNVTGSRKMEPSLQGNGLYETTVSVTATGDSTKWKFHAFPPEHFSNSGWETGNDNWFVYGQDTVLTIGPRVPRITPSAPSLTEDVNVLFQVDMNGAKNAYDNTDIPKSDIFFVGIKGSANALGAWGGVWTVTDTTTSPKTIIPLNDSGFFGDKVAGDNVWSRMITFVKGTPGGAVEFKYACWYKDADKHTTSANVLDNEAGFGANHSFQLVNSTSVIELRNAFGNMTTDVKQVKSNLTPTEYNLAQNFPNPFNPATTIRYSVPKAGLVTLKIFNMLGQEVATLVNTQMNPGNYEVSFDASRLSSGIYLYNLTSGSFSSTKKMMLVK